MTSMYFQHAVGPRKGWPNPVAVDVQGKLSPNVTLAVLYGGRVAHVNASGQFEAGAIGTQMPVVMIQGSDAPDVNNPSPSGAYAWYPIAPIGVMSGLVAIGGYELETTEYDQTSTYAINDALHAPTEGQITGTDKSVAGMLFNARKWPGGNSLAIVQYTDAICGIVSPAAAHTNELRQSVLAFWPYFLPGADATK